MNRAIAMLQSAGSIRREERIVAGRAGGLVWVIASLSIVALALVTPGIHRTALLAIGAAGCAWGVVSGLALQDSRRPVWLIHLSTAVGTVAIAVAVSLSGGARSPAWACLFYVVVFAAYFLKPAAAAVYFVACVAIELIVVLAASPASRAQGTAKAVIAAPAFLVLGTAIIAGKRFMLDLRRRSDRLAAEQSALRRVATAAVSGEPAERFYELVAVEAGGLLGASGAGVLRLAGAREATILGSWARDPQAQYAVGDRLPVPPHSDVASALGADQPVHASQTPGSLLGRLGHGSSIVAPIRVGGRTWGFLAVVFTDPEPPATDQTRRLDEFAELIAISVANIEDRAVLAAQAATDALTGVGNHRTFHQRLEADLARARRYGSPVSVAIIDVDHFKQVNDTLGHEAGDDLLRHVAGCLSNAARAEDTLARVGGDEFAWILPETTGNEALAAVERARRSAGLCAAGPDAEPRMTISAGVCDSRWTSDPTELVRLADRALYFSKAHGRNRVHVYAVDTDDLAGASPAR
ncbi:MAG TPA: sensor domain-containing diguanylate cyclase [Solirubrobacteraceae bacterium]|jgi:diguanylate cyclase (GGDEF)-like protein|nr:sensor domain-containing diguanylate cyclase [Solirubrobacteraceae bacterium]